MELFATEGLVFSMSERENLPEQAVLKCQVKAIVLGLYSWNGAHSFSSRGKIFFYQIGTVASLVGKLLWESGFYVRGIVGSPLVTLQAVQAATSFFWFVAYQNILFGCVGSTSRWFWVGHLFVNLVTTA